MSAVLNRFESDALDIFRFKLGNPYARLDNTTCGRASLS